MIRLSLLLLAALTCCSGSRDPSRCPFLPVDLQLSSDKLLNLNAQGQSMPVELRILYLTESLKFEALDFDSVWQDSTSELGNTLAGSTSMTVFPGEDKIAPLKAPPQTAYVALVGLFRHPHDQDWRSLVDVRAAGKECGSSDEAVLIRVRMQDNRLISQ